MSSYAPGLGPTVSSEIVNAATTLTRRDMFGNSNPFVTHAGTRDMNAVFGYPEVVTYSETFAMFRRHGIATRLTRGVSRSCWRDVPKIKVDDKEILEEEMNVFAKKRMFRKLEQADTLNRIGRFSVLFVGVQDGQDLDQPLGKALRGKNGIDEVYFHAYSEAGTEVVAYDTEVTSPRFGLPLKYQLQIRDIGNGKITTDTTVRIVHYSRVVHLAEDSLDNDVEGFSALEPVYNYLIDLMKSGGGSAEAYWRNARRVLAFMAKDGIGNATPEQLEQLRTDIEAFTNGWSDAIRLGNVEVEQLQADLADPKEVILGSLKLISGSTGIPLRILTGEGGGQTTGSEDKAAYNSLVHDRQEMMCSDWLLQTLDIFSNAGIIEPLPINAVVDWPVSESLNEKDKSEARKNNANALSLIAAAVNPISGGLAGIVDVHDIISEVLDMDIDVDETGGDDGLTDADLDEIPATAPGM